MSNYNDANHNDANRDKKYIWDDTETCNFIIIQTNNEPIRKQFILVRSKQNQCLLSLVNRLRLIIRNIRITRDKLIMRNSFIRRDELGKPL